MRRVGEQLEELAKASTEGELVDVFGRSAFNRYYYASFLATRQMLGELNPSWKHTAHAEIPNLLETGVRKPVKQFLKRVERSGDIKPGKCSQMRTDLDNATNGLAELLRLAYDVRIISDYEPEEPIQKNGSVITLRLNKLNAASQWIERTHRYIKVIRKTWKEAGLV